MTRRPQRKGGKHNFQEGNYLDTYMISLFLFNLILLFRWGFLRIKTANDLQVKRINILYDNEYVTPIQINFKLIGVFFKISFHHNKC